MSIAMADTICTFSLVSFVIMNCLLRVNMMRLSLQLSCGSIGPLLFGSVVSRTPFCIRAVVAPLRRNHGSFRLHTENEGEFVIVATIKCISPCDNLELSEVSSEFTELEWTVIFGLLVKSDGEAEMAVDTKNVK